MLGADKIFERQFTPYEGGYLYYPFGWSHGYRVTEEEFRKLCEDRKRHLSFIGTIKWLLPLLIVFMIVSAVPAILLDDERFLTAGNIAVVISILAFFIWKSTATIRLVRGREPIAPPRGRVERERDNARIIGWPMMMLMVLLSVWFVILSGMIAYTSPLIGVPLLAIFGFALVRNSQIALRKYKEGTRSP